MALLERKMKMKRRNILAGLLALLMVFSVMPAESTLAASRKLKASTKRQYYSLGKVRYRDLVNVTWAKRAGYSKKSFKNVKSLLVKRSAYDLTSKKTVRTSFKLKKTRTSLKDKRFTPGHSYKNIRYTLYAKKKNGKLLKLGTKKIRTKKAKKFIRRWRGKNMAARVKGFEYKVYDTQFAGKLGEGVMVDEPSEGRFLIMDYSIKNTKYARKNDINNLIQLEDSKGRLYNRVHMFNVHTSDRAGWLEGGETHRDNIAFDVPKWVAESSKTKLKITYIKPSKKQDTAYIYVNK